MYNIRSSFVHGSEISLELFTRDHANIVLTLEHFVERALIAYIELVNSGLNKKEIIGKLDSRALGLPDDAIRVNSNHYNIKFLKGYGHSISVKDSKLILKSQTMTLFLSLKLKNGLSKICHMRK